MKKTLSMPEISTCTMTECAYNHDACCHARAITVGGANDHFCDTSFPGFDHVRRQASAGVGACKAVSCRFNKALECCADRIQVAKVRDIANCMSFESRM